MKKRNKQLRSLLVTFAVILAVVAVLGTVVVVDSSINDRSAKEISIDEAQRIVNDTFDALPAKQAKGAQWLGETVKFSLTR